MNPNQLDLNLLRVFDAILETRSVTVAASTLGLTQSTVSNQLARLREAFDDPLFVRTSEGMVPTPRAEAMAEPIRQSLVAIRLCVEEQLGFDPATSDRTFKIYMSDVGQMVFLPRLLERTAQIAPQVNIHSVQVPQSRLRDAALEAGDVDLAMGYFEDFDGSYRQQKLFDERYVGMVRRNHPTIRDKLTFEVFLKTPQLVYQPRGGGHGYQESAVDQVFVAAGVPRRVAVRAAHAMGVTSIVSSTDLLVVVPSRLAAACRELAEVSILALPVDIPSFEIKQHWHERFHRDPGNAWLRRLVAELFQESRGRPFDGRPEDQVPARPGA
ncbi:MAG TPA: LysR family transcriptional regulator [Alphaproteobacteria bacterium]|jgi:DNA-binding transcriptional LysR family regulator|nr:LysR family transcriptional regulator [Alphaproteobacteria bacterium]